MDRDRTVALFLEGREAWNAWAGARLAERKAMEADGRWSAQKLPWGDLKAKNDETRAWMKSAAADFFRCLFLVGGAEGTKETAGEDKESSESSAPTVKSIQLEADNVDFSGFIFPGYADFQSATFTGYAGFQSATFTGGARFESATFTGGARFVRATFTGYADFQSATFTGGARFESATFTGGAVFESTTFTGDAGFQSATFTGNAFFESATFTGNAGFRGQTFTNDVFFNGAKFGPKGTADFGLATFERVVQFDGAAFEGRADFNAVWGKRTFSMAGACFEGVPDFIQAHFEEAPRLDNVIVKGRVIAAAKDDEPTSRLAKLHRTLRDRSRVYRHIVSADRDMPARWRALKRLAIQACDQDSEHAFFAGEVRAARLAGDWPLFFVPPKWEGLPHWLGWINWVPFVFWRPEAWAGFFRFWAGWAYEIFSDFGRSILRPLLFWLLVMTVATVYFLGESVQPPGLAGSGVAGTAQAYARQAWDALRDPPRCFAGTRRELAVEQKIDADGRVSKVSEEKKVQVTFSGLTATAAGSTDALKEAINLSWHNAFIVLDGGADAAHRTYGCLYGVERYGGNPVAFVPSSVARASGAQKLLSALFIFLFGLALRNMLKMK